MPVGSRDDEDHRDHKMGKIPKRLKRFNSVKESRNQVILRQALRQTLYQIKLISPVSCTLTILLNKLATLDPYAKSITDQSMCCLGTILYLSETINAQLHL